MAETASPFSGLACPKCGETDCLKLRLDDLETLDCGANDCEITLEEVREQLALWEKLLRWIGKANQ